MATVQQDNVVVEYAPAVPYQILVDGTFDINGGDLVWYDSTTKTIKSLDSDAHAAHLAGMAKNGSFLQVFSSKKYFDQIPVLQKGLVRLFTTAAETYNDNDPLFYGGDAQTITNVDPGGGHKIGYAKMQAAQGVTTVTGAAGVQIQVLLAVQDPTSAFA